MDRLITRYKEILNIAAQAEGELARTATFALENVDWTGNLNTTAPQSNAVVDGQLAEACALSGQAGSATQHLASALLSASDQINWRINTKAHIPDPDVVLFSRSFTANTIIGEGGIVPSENVRAGFSLQGRDTYYPPHAHLAEESYWIIGGNGDWKVDTKPWFGVEASSSIYHKSEARHAMQTNDVPMLAIWLWTNHLDSEVKIIRG